MPHLIGYSPGEPAKSHALRVFEVSLGVLIGALLLKLASAFYLSKTEVTWLEWAETRDWALANGYEDLSSGKNGREADESGMHPVTEVSWSNALIDNDKGMRVSGASPIF